MASVRGAQLRWARSGRLSSHRGLSSVIPRRILSIEQTGDPLVATGVDRVVESLPGIGPKALARQASTPFRLSPKFMKEYSSKKAPFGFNGLGELVYHRTYSRVREDGENEDWHDTVQRVVEGTFNMQKGWLQSSGLGWDESKKQIEAEEMFDRIFNFKFLPPGRGLWAMGSQLTEDR
eukprot:249922-Amorphochlora_amoeboformis.AAC.1